MRIQLQDVQSAKATVDLINNATQTGSKGPGQYARLVHADGVSFISPYKDANLDLGIDLGLLIESADIVPTEVFGESLAQFTVWGEKAMFTITLDLNVQVLIGLVNY